MVDFRITWTCSRQSQPRIEEIRRNTQAKTLPYQGDFQSKETP